MDTLRSLLIILFILICISCNNSNNSQGSPIDSTKIVRPALKTDETKPRKVVLSIGQEQYALIVDMHQRNDTIIIDADYIQYFSGQAAIDAAIKAHQADTFKTADGKTHFDVPNDIFIVNNNKKIRSLALDKNCVIDLIINPDGLPPITDNSLSSLKKAYKNSTFILTLNNENVVLGIKEVFVP